MHTKVRLLSLTPDPPLNITLGHKSAVYTHGNYLVIVSPPFFPSATSTSATVRNFVARNNNAGETDITKVTVFDPENKLVAYSGTFRQGVRDVISQWGNVYILSTDGTVRRPSSRLCCTDILVADCAPREIDGNEARYAVPEIALPTRP